ncbi:MAG: NAD-dependent epimerase/dehydratase family protein [Chloroflexota bacterium]|nr:MAG: NAD-dependent epimerase/dehydratase family protein [Chloroflexota bacterium]
MIPSDRFDGLLERPELAFDEERPARRFRGASVLVTGAGGSIGSALVRQLIELGAERVVCYESHEPSLFRLGVGLRDLGLGSRAVLSLGDARDAPRIDRLVSSYSVDAVFALAAYKHVPLAEENADQVAAVNVVALADAIEVCDSRQVANFIFPSSDKAVRPPSLYGATKRFAECAVRERGSSAATTQGTAVRLVNVFGTAGNVIELFAARFAAGQRVGLTDERMTRYWMTRREAVWLLATASTLANESSLYIGAVGDPVPLLTTTRRLASMMGVDDPQIDIVGIRPGERLSEELAYAFETVVATPVADILEIVSQRRHPRIVDAVARLRTCVATGDAFGARSILMDASFVT